MPNAPMAGIPLLRPQRIPGGTMPIANNSLIGGFKNTSLASERLIADDPTHRHYSQHSNILAVWLDVVPRERQKEALERILSTSDAGFPASATLPAMTSATYYFRFYLARALAHAGMGDQYLQLLGPWRVGRVARADALRFSCLECSPEFRLADNCGGDPPTVTWLRNRHHRTASWHTQPRRSVFAGAKRNGGSEVSARRERGRGASHFARRDVGRIHLEGTRDSPPCG
jgi:hypothetical protein